MQNTNEPAIGATTASVVVISQPMFLPWMGHFNQALVSDSFVHYDDVQLPMSNSFISRVQLGSGLPTQWLSIPLTKGSRGRPINEVLISEAEDWKDRHLTLISNTFKNSPNFVNLMKHVEMIYSNATNSLASFNADGFEYLCRTFGINSEFHSSSSLQISGSSSQRLLDICQRLNANTYVTGLGARNYLDHAIFEAQGIEVLYPRYNFKPWRQAGSSFNPRVSILEVMAEVEDTSVKSHLMTQFVGWRMLIEAGPEAIHVESRN